MVTPVAGFIHDPAIWIELDFQRHVLDHHGQNPGRPPVASAVEADFELLKVTHVDVRIADRIGLRVTGEVDSSSTSTEPEQISKPRTSLRSVSTKLLRSG